MSVAAARSRDFFGRVNGARRVGAGDTGVITLVPAPMASMIRVQTIHVEVTGAAVGELWTFQDAFGTLIVPNVSAGAIGHFDFEFGADGVPCRPGRAFVLNITGATGATGWITWEAFTLLTPVADFAAEVLADHPLGYWPLTDRVGATSITDASGNGFNGGAVVGAVTFGQPGPLTAGGTAALFGGGNINFGHVDALAFAGAFSVLGWVRTVSAVTGGVVGQTNVSTGVGWVCELHTGQVRLWAYTAAGATIFDVKATPLVNDGLWHFIGGTWDGTANPNGVKLYIDGGIANQFTAANAGPIGNAVEVFSVGSSSTNFPFAGTLGQVAIYNYALSAQRIADQYRAARSAA